MSLKDSKMTNDFDLRKNWWTITSVEEYNSKKPMLKYVFMGQVINLLSNILLQLKKLNKSK